MRGIFAKLRDAAAADPKTVRFGPVAPADVAAAEDYLGFALPKLLKRSYTEIGNGGFGPGLLIGLPGGYESSWGDLLQTWTVMHEHEEHEESWLPIVDWGCAQFSLVDCDDQQMVTLYDGDFHLEDYTFEGLLARWIGGELPELHSGEFSRRGS
jgi:hypothetical protein